MNDKVPVFVKMDDYKDIVDLISLMREKINKAKFLLDKIAEVKAKEDAELADWSRDLDDVEAKVSAIDRSLSKPSV